jgi:hypothetical protein
VAFSDLTFIKNRPAILELKYVNLKTSWPHIRSFYAHIANNTEKGACEKPLEYNSVTLQNTRVSDVFPASEGCIVASDGKISKYL